MEQIKSPIKALDDDILEQVSGGADAQENFSIGFNAYLQFSNIVNIIINDSVAEELNKLAKKVYYRDVIKTIASYDTSSKPVEEKLSTFSTSWSANHPNSDPMSMRTASMILALGEYPVLRAQLACMTDVGQIETELATIYQSQT